MADFWNEDTIFAGSNACGKALFLFGSSLNHNGWAVFSEQLYELGILTFMGRRNFYNPAHSWMDGDDDFLKKNGQWLKESALKDAQGRFYATSVIHPLGQWYFTEPSIRILRDPRNSVVGMQKYYKGLRSHLHDTFVLSVPTPAKRGGFFGLPYVEEFFLQLFLLRAINDRQYTVYYEHLKGGSDELYRFAKAVCLPVTEEQCIAAYTRSLAHTGYISKDTCSVNQQILGAHANAIAACFECDLPYSFEPVSPSCSWPRAVLFQAIQLHGLNLCALYPFFDTPHIHNIINYSFLRLARQLDRVPLLRVYLCGALLGSAMHDFAQRELVKLMGEEDRFAALCARAIYEGHSLLWLRDVLAAEALLDPQESAHSLGDPSFRLIAMRMM